METRRSRTGNSSGTHPLLLPPAWGRQPAAGQPAAEPPGTLWPPGPATSPAAGWQVGAATHRAGGRQTPTAPRHGAAGGDRHPRKASLQPVVSIHTLSLLALSAPVPHTGFSSSFQSNVFFLPPRSVFPLYFLPTLQFFAGPISLKSDTKAASQLPNTLSG